MSAFAEEHRRLNILVISNPAAGPRRSLRLRRVMAHLAGLGASVTLRETTCRGDAEAFARRAMDEDWDVIAVAGGDGTVNEVLNGLRHGAPPVAVIPLGTANVLAAEIGIPLQPRKIARLVVTGPVRTVHLGRASGRRFVMMLGVGFDAAVVERVGPRLKRIAGRAAYVVHSLVAAFRFAGRHCHVTIDGRPFTAASVVVANGRYYGGRFTCAPSARLDRASLEVCLFGRSGAIGTLTYMAALAAGRLHRLKSVAVITGTRIQIFGESAGPVQADGDLTVGSLPLDISIDKQTIDMVMGFQAGGSSGPWR